MLRSAPKTALARARARLCRPSPPATPAPCSLRPLPCARECRGQARPRATAAAPGWRDKAPDTFCHHLFRNKRKGHFAPSENGLSWGESSKERDTITEPDAACTVSRNVCSDTFTIDRELFLRKATEAPPFTESCPKTSVEAPGEKTGEMRPGRGALLGPPVLSRDRELFPQNPQFTNTLPAGPGWRSRICG